MKDETVSPQSPEPPSLAAAAAQSAARRRLLRAGLGSAPVLLTFVNIPAHADVQRCISASATVSANASGKLRGIALGDIGCTARGPAEWTSNGLQNSTKSSNVSTFLSNGPSGTTVLQILQTTGTSDAQKLARNIMAALLNLLNGDLALSVVNTAQLNSMWLVCNGSAATWAASPTNGINWTAAQTNAWFATMFTPA